MRRLELFLLFLLLLASLLIFIAMATAISWYTVLITHFLWSVYWWHEVTPVSAVPGERISPALPFQGTASSRPTVNNKKIWSSSSSSSFIVRFPCYAQVGRFLPIKLLPTRTLQCPLFHFSCMDFFLWPDAFPDANPPLFPGLAHTEAALTH